MREPCQVGALFSIALGRGVRSHFERSLERQMVMQRPQVVSSNVLRDLEQPCRKTREVTLIVRARTPRVLECPGGEVLGIAIAAQAKAKIIVDAWSFVRIHGIPIQLV